MAVKKVFLMDGVVVFYLECKSINETAKKFGYAASTLYKLFKENKVCTTMDYEKQRQRMIGYKIDETLFEKIDSRDKAYILGVIFSDGHLYHNLKQVRIKLTDIDLLEEIRKRIGYAERPLIETKNVKVGHKASKMLIICNAKICQDLMRVGLKKNKSYENIFPTIKYHLVRDFIRGFFDGNGYFGTWKQKSGYIVGRVEIVSTLLLCKRMQMFLRKEKISSVITQDKRHDIRVASLKIRNVEDLVRFYLYMYQGIGDGIFLKRKFIKYKSYVDHRKNNIGSIHKNTLMFSSLNVTKTW